MHIYTILEKPHIDKVQAIVSAPFACISAPYAANMIGVNDFIALCTASSALDPTLFFDCGTQKAKALEAMDTGIAYVIYRGESNMLTEYARDARVTLLNTRPIALNFSINPDEWENEILTFQANSSEILN